MRITPAVFLSIAMVLSISVSAEKAQQIVWRDLTFPIDIADDPYYGLGLEQRKSFDKLLEVRRMRQAGKTPGAYDIEAETMAFERLASEEPDGHALLEKEVEFRKKLRRQRTSMREELANRIVKIPGYPVPLEFEDKRVIEFLLVPYAGACIHTPPPPANQIVVVRYEQGFPMNDLFTPIWVTGRLSIDRSQQSVDLSDGSTAFEVGYALEAAKVAEYRQ